MSFIATLKNIFGLSSIKDRRLKCEDCHRIFVFDAGEQKFFKEKGFTDPKRCPTCRKRVKSRLHRKSRNHRGGYRRGNRFRRNTLVDGLSPYADE